MTTIIRQTATHHEIRRTDQPLVALLNGGWLQFVGTATEVAAEIARRAALPGQYDLLNLHTAPVEHVEWNDQDQLVFAALSRIDAYLQVDIRRRNRDYIEDGDPSDLRVHEIDPADRNDALAIYRWGALVAVASETRLREALDRFGFGSIWDQWRRESDDQDRQAEIERGVSWVAAQVAQALASADYRAGRAAVAWHRDPEVD